MVIVQTGFDARRDDYFRRFPTVRYLRDGAKRHLPAFAYEYLDGGAGSDAGIEANARALDAVQIVPRYGIRRVPPNLVTPLFGSDYSAPFGIAPMGGPSIVLPGADAHLAAAAQKARVPYILGSVAGMTLEQAGRLAPDVLWFQLYRMARNDYFYSDDLMDRARSAGAKVLVLTMDVPARTTRPREVRRGLTSPFRLKPSHVIDALLAPRWLAALARHGRPTFANFLKYLDGKTDFASVSRFASRELGGAFTWEDVARFRDVWTGPLVVKGILHPKDAARAVELGVDGVYVSNHGGRQIEGLVPSIDVLPAIADTISNRCTILADSGITSGMDVLRCVSAGAGGAFMGKALLWALGALGADGPRYLVELIREEIVAAMAQLGIDQPADVRASASRHPGRFRFQEEQSVCAE